ncbi:uncharacterized protein HHUB_4343 (plasmid) [Halobacterium hubeiense]|uniref:Uncharacterized protein n=1 Tax=Halobacterium hubeiense TaxID=1407499 RepID=A0A0U5H4V1_9EURY|nr:uncharacterized protein HHUB_4343 [Halobacterium hubeiense]
MESRRQYLVGLVGVISISGCLSTSSPSAEVTRIQLINKTEREHDFTVTLREDGQRVYQESFTVASEEGNRTAMITEIPSNRGRIEVEVAVAKEEVSSSIEYTEKECYDMIITYSQSGFDFYSNSSGDC